MRTVPPSPICGLMRSVRPTSLRSMVWNGLSRRRVPVLVNWPVMNGTFWPTTIFASSLSSVIRFGVDRMLALAWVSQEARQRAEHVGRRDLVQQADVQAGHGTAIEARPVAPLPTAAWPG